MKGSKKNKYDYKKDIEEIAKWCDILKITNDELFSMSENELTTCIDDLIFLSNKSKKNSQNNNIKLNKNSRSTKDGKDSFVIYFNNVDGKNFGNKELDENSLTENIQIEKRVRAGEGDDTYAKCSGLRYFDSRNILSDTQEAESRSVGGGDNVENPCKEKEDISVSQKLYKLLEENTKEFEQLLKLIEVCESSKSPTCQYPKRNVKTYYDSPSVKPFFQYPKRKVKTYYDSPSVKPFCQYPKRKLKTYYDEPKPANKENLSPTKSPTKASPICQYPKRKVKTYYDSPSVKPIFQYPKRKLKTYYDEPKPANVENLSPTKSPTKAAPICQYPKRKLKTYNDSPTVQLYFQFPKRKMKTYYDSPSVKPFCQYPKRKLKTYYDEPTKASPTFRYPKSKSKTYYDDPKPAE